MQLKNQIESLKKAYANKLQLKRIAGDRIFLIAGGSMGIPAKWTVMVMSEVGSGLDCLALSPVNASQSEALIRGRA